MHDLKMDLRLAFRTLGTRPGFTLVAILAIALGIGANSAIFSVVNAVYLRPYPYPDPDRLMFVLERSSQVESMALSMPDFLDLEAQSHSFEQIGLFQRDNFNLTGVDQPERLIGRRVSPSLLPMLGVQPALGRNLARDEADPGAAPVVLISDELWQRHFGGSTAAVGKIVKLDGRDTTIVGVLPQDFRFFSQAQVVVPLVADAVQGAGQRDSRGSLIGVARLADGVALESARAEMDALALRLEKAYPASNAGVRIRLTPLPEAIAADFGGPARALLGAVGFVLLIACANVANLLLARASARRREMAIRAALGASRLRIVRQLLTESVLLSLLGGGAGLLMAVWGVDVLVRLHPAGVPRLDELSVDGSVLGFTLALSFACGLLFGLAPALQASRPDVVETLKAGGKDPATPGRQLTRGALVAAEMALALALLVGAGLMMRSFLRLQGVDPGFKAGPTLTMQISLRPDGYKTAEPTLAFYDQLLERVRDLPGVQSAAVASGLPLSGVGLQTTFWIGGRPLPPPGQLPNGVIDVVSDDYFQTLHIPVLRGRSLDASDTRTSRAVAMIDQSVANQLFAGQDPIGQRLTDAADPPHFDFEIVGVVAHVHFFNLEGHEPVPYQFYIPYRQLPAPVLRGQMQTMTLLVQAGDEPMGLLPAIRERLRSVDPEQPVYNIQLMQDVLDQAVAGRRFNTMSLGLFAVLALVLAAVGVYGVVAQSVAQRTHEIGVRMAMGAHRRDVLRLVVGQGMRPSLLGVGVGLGVGLVVGRLLQSLLFQVGPADPPTFAAVAGGLLAVALLACLGPARRASRVDPMVALRHE